MTCAQCMAGRRDEQPSRPAANSPRAFARPPSYGIAAADRKGVLPGARVTQQMLEGAG